MLDIYFEENYGRLYEKVENGKCVVFEFEHSLGSVRHLFIKREIPIQLKGESYYDLVTPYGYGGPVITECKNNKEELVQEFQLEFQKYCFDNNIVSEFVRFHPLLSNEQDFKDCYTVNFRRNTTGTTLKPYDDPVQTEFSKSTKKAIRKALNAGVEFNVIVNPKSLKEFQRIYYATMKRIDASSHYFFDDEYFSDCLNFFGKNLILVEATYDNQVIGMELHFLYNNILHTHLSGSIEDFHHLSPVYVLTYAIALWGKENGVKLIHSGGGVTSDPEDGLYLFKKRFGKNTEFDYFVGYKVWNKNLYEKLMEAAEVNRNTEFFPAYRENENPAFN
ncbi:peptidoglycan bridge formation glycyltransferase FemA/FemB family protein [Metaplanococcus flavidus]|uniref:Lipid II:glycine glycyltransferase n=1 Tax=Metaplanococcus flavidus TaxID=569883 RepID=A0ABW3L9N7_9BACL